MKKSFKKIARRLTGISTPIFGISWNPPESEREIIRKLINFLEDRRVLYNPYWVETDEYAIRSVNEIRGEITETIGTLNEKCSAVENIRAMRAACRKFMNELEMRDKNIEIHLGKAFYNELQHTITYQTLAELRAVFGIHIAQLSVKYGIDIEEDLARILPFEDVEENDAEETA